MSNFSLGMPTPATCHTLPSSAATTNATAVVAGVRTIQRAIGRNTGGTSVFLKFYDKATAPTPGTDTPFLNIEIPPATAFDQQIDVSVTLGIGYAMTGTGALNSSTVIAAGAITGFNLIYS